MFKGFGKGCWGRPGKVKDMQYMTLFLVLWRRKSDEFTFVSFRNLEGNANLLSELSRQWFGGWVNLSRNGNWENSGSNTFDNFRLENEACHEIRRKLQGIK
ncbi:hypothetical protein Nepgr_004576 [Nepenthes gracilis]|uniref:Uncharacterized protein n=1 Tax=Nepenthes gracilis TaxID=150966 RepID=A0AAD3S1T8_NEPGR|nr:hypothetical protein Nepgr_004576 [Nepenthes gracilis]